MGEEEKRRGGRVCLCVCVGGGGRCACMQQSVLLCEDKAKTEPIT
jgi:hypothetical protein